MSAIATFQPDVVLMDISLPDVSGVVVYRQIAARWPELGVLFSTGHVEESGLPPLPSRYLGMLRKPYTLDTLLRRLREVA
jgi:DNA-binding NarL/FixJ family response regulator